MIEVFTWIFVLLLVAGYVAFFAGRHRREQAAKRPTEPPTPTRPSVTMPASPPLEPLPQVAAPWMPASEAGVPEAAAPDGPTVLPPGSPGTSPPSLFGSPGNGAAGGEVADLIRGIRLPDELVPRPDVIPRPSVHDRVVFTTTDAPADIVRERLTSALELIGTDVRWGEDRWLALLSRDGRAGWLRVHPTPTGIVPPGTLLAPTVPGHTVCAEFWTDAG